MDNQSPQNTSQSSPLLSQDQFRPGIIKERMLVVTDTLANGDMVYGDGTNNFQRLPIGSQGSLFWVSSDGTPSWLGNGTNGQVLKMAGGIPTWSAISTTALTLYRASTGADFTSSSTSYVDVTNYAISGIVIPTTSDIEISAMISYQKNTTTGNGQNVFQLLYGSTVVGVDIYATTTGTSLNQALFIRETVKGLVAGNYAFKLQAKNNAAGTITVGPGEFTVTIIPV